MKHCQTKYLFIMILLYDVTGCTAGRTIQNLQELFENINQNLLKHNVIAADIAWQSTINPEDPELPDRAARYEKDRISWQHRTCDLIKQLGRDHLLNRTQRRQTYLLCRGPKWLIPEARQVSSLYDELQSIYSDSKVCIPISKRSQPIDAETAILNYLQHFKSPKKASGQMSVKFIAEKKFENGMCFQGENDFENLMRSKTESVLEWTWLVWRETVGPPMRKPYRLLAEIENRASERNGYSDIGAAWRDELETAQPRQLARRLYREVRPLYAALHGIARFFLRRLYGDSVPERGPIPAHLAGDLWSQNWGHLADLILPEAKGCDLDHSIKNTNWTVLDMVQKADDFYTSLSLPPMTAEFWRRSVLQRSDGVRCHGTAADMFVRGDFRMLYCARVTMEDFYVIHHEMGHIQYYMAYQDQPAIFREGTNSAFHETIGDAVMNGVVSPQHLYRLGLINDSLLFDEVDTQTYEDTGTVGSFINYIKKKEKLDKSKNKAVNPNYNQVNEDDNDPTEINDDVKPKAKDKVRTKISFDEIHLLKQALVKIPQIPFSLLVDEYRWALFEGDFDDTAYNREFWRLVLELQGVAAPGYTERGEEFFDAGAKFHIPDNTPYIRYFLSSFLQAQVFRSLCRATVLGAAHTDLRLPTSLPLHRCDIYGSKQAGHLLQKMMSQGASIHWRQALEMLTGEQEISSEALLQYYRPLYPLLTELIETYDIPIGW